MLALSSSIHTSFAGPTPIRAGPIRSTRSSVRMNDDGLQDRIDKAVPVFADVALDQEYKSPEDILAEQTAYVGSDFDPSAFVQTLPGITAPLGFWDPAGFCSSNNGADGSATEGKVRFYREVEVKHARVAMLAALGFPLAEQWHPLFATDDAPSFSAFQLTPLQTFWPAVVFVIAVIEIYSIFPAFVDPNTEGWAIKPTHVAGDFGFDPLGLKPTDPEELKVMQTKELNNGRLAMVSACPLPARTHSTSNLMAADSGTDLLCMHPMRAARAPPRECFSLS